jgi:hypothetical protein
LPRELRAPRADVTLRIERMTVPVRRALTLTILAVCTQRAQPSHPDAATATCRPRRCCAQRRCPGTVSTALALATLAITKFTAADLTIAALPLSVAILAAATFSITTLIKRSPHNHHRLCCHRPCRVLGAALSMITNHLLDMITVMR